MEDHILFLKKSSGLFDSSIFFNKKKRKESENPQLISPFRLTKVAFDEISLRQSVHGHLEPLGSSFLSSVGSEKKIKPHPNKGKIRTSSQKLRRWWGFSQKFTEKLSDICWISEFWRSEFHNCWKVEVSWNAVFWAAEAFGMLGPLNPKSFRIPKLDATKIPTLPGLQKLLRVFCAY